MSPSHARLDYPDFTERAPAAYKALVALGAAVAASGLEKELTELVKLRASQINGCAFCLQYHLTLARGLGLPQAKLDLLAAWRDAGVFSDREKAALAWAEELTAMTAASASDAAYAALLAQFTPDEAVFLTVAIGTINQWNRIAVGLRFAPVLTAPSAASAA